MSYIQAKVQNEYFYILPVCNLLPYVSTVNVAGGVTGNSTTLYSTPLDITIPDYIKALDIDYISFGANPGSTTQLPSNVVVAQIVYDTGSNNFNVINSAGTSVNLATDSEYRVEIRVINGELLPIDIKSIKKITTSGSGASSTWIAAPTNITLWKRFVRSGVENKNSFVQDGKLPLGPNAT
jgi:hypothetical protein